ncbi:MAG: transposase [Planctomycetaceae bacterium]|nr:transposase [Planctomycetaceae bacterium]
MPLDPRAIARGRRALTRRIDTTLPTDRERIESKFRCQACGHEQHADIVGARNIRNAALSQGRAPVARNAKDLRKNNLLKFTIA